MMSLWDSPRWNALAARLGIDFHQYRHLLSASLRLDFRRRSVRLDAQTTQSALVMTCLIYGLFSLMMSLAFVFATPITLFHYSVLLLAYSMTMMALVVLSEFGATIISPDDYEILGHRPISSRTYFAVKLSNLLFYVLLFGASLSLFPAVLGAFARESRWYFPLVYFPAALAADLFSASLVILFYGALLKVINYEKFKDVIVYLQVALSLAVLVGYQLIPRSIRYVEQGHVADFDRWVLLIPPGWFAGLVQIGLGHITRDYAVWALWAMLATVFLLGAGLRSFSLDYSAHLARLRTAASDSRSPSARSRQRVRWLSPLERLLLRHPEERAGFYFTRQMLHRNRVLKLRLYPTLGFPLAFLLIGFVDKSLGDPLVSKKFQTGSFFSAMVGPMLVQSFLTLLPYSEEHAAGWIFQASPLQERERFFSSLKKAFCLSLLLPLFVILAVVFSFIWPLSHALVHAAFGLAMAYFYLGVASLFYRGGYPFSEPIVKGVQAQQMSLVFVFFPAFGALLYLQYLVYRRQAILWLVMAVIVGLGVALNKIANRRIARSLEQMEGSASSESHELPGNRS